MFCLQFLFSAIIKPVCCYFQTKRLSGLRKGQPQAFSPQSTLVLCFSISALIINALQYSVAGTMNFKGKSKLKLLNYYTLRPSCQKF